MQQAGFWARINLILNNFHVINSKFIFLVFKLIYEIKRSTHYRRCRIVIVMRTIFIDCDASNIPRDFYIFLATLEKRNSRTRILAIDERSIQRTTDSYEFHRHNCSLNSSKRSTRVKARNRNTVFYLSTNFPCHVIYAIVMAIVPISSLQGKWTTKLLFHE